MNISQIDLSKVPDEKIEAIIDGLVKNNFTEFNKFFSQFGTLYGQKPEDLLDNKYAQNVVLDKIEIHKLLKEKTFVVNERIRELLKRIFDKFFELHHKTKHDLIDKINATKDEVMESLTNLINNISAELTQKLTDESEIRLNKDLELEEKIETVDYAVSDLKTRHNERISNLETKTTENTTAIRDEILDRKNAIAELKATISGRIDDKIDQSSAKIDELSNKVTEARENFNDKIAEIRENVTTKIEKNANDIANLADKSRHNYESILELDNKINNVQQDVEEIRDNTIPNVQQDIEDIRDNNIPAINSNLNDIGDRVTTLEQIQLSVVQDISDKIIGNEELVGRIAAEAATQTATIVNGAIQQFTTDKFDPTISRLDAKDQKLEKKLTTEIFARKNADNDLSQRIVDETTARENADNQLTEALAAETTSRENADNQLTEALATETTSREIAVEQLNRTLSIDISHENNSLIYTITQGERNVGTINIPKDQFLHDAQLSGNNLILTFDTNSGLTPISVDFSKFTDIYSGNTYVDRQFGILTKVEQIDGRNVIDAELDNEFTNFLNELSANVATNNNRIVDCQRDINGNSTSIRQMGVNFNNKIDYLSNDFIPEQISLTIENYYTKDEVDILANNLEDKIYSNHIAPIRTTINEINQHFANVDQNISTAQNDIIDLDDRIAIVEDTVSDIQDNLTQEISDRTSDINTISSTINEKYNELSEKINNKTVRIADETENLSETDKQKYSIKYAFYQGSNDSGEETNLGSILIPAPFKQFEALETIDTNDENFGIPTIANKINEIINLLNTNFINNN